jgi:hypothetical protein
MLKRGQKLEQGIKRQNTRRMAERTRVTEVIAVYCNYHVAAVVLQTHPASVLP